MKFSRYILVFVTVLYLCFIWGNSLQSGNDSEGFSMRVVELLQKFFEFSDTARLNLYVRKLAHFSEFAGFALLLCLCFSAFGIRFRYFLVYVLFFGLSAAVADEFIQFFIDGRGSSVRDVVIDFGGVVFGSFFYKTAALYLREFLSNLRRPVN